MRPERDDDAAGGSSPPPPRLGGLSAGRTGLRRYIGPKRVVLLALFGAAVAYVWRLHGDGSLNPDAIRGYLDAYPLISMAVFVGLYAAAVAGCVPSLPFNLAAGLFWGPWVGGLLATAGATTGAVVSFTAARLLAGRPFARRFDHRFAGWLQDEFERGAWRFLAFLRLNPVVPTGPLNYLLGLTSIRLSTYVWCTAVFLAPPSTAVAWIGDALQVVAPDGQAGSWIRAVAAVSAAAACLAVLGLVGRYLGRRGKAGAIIAPPTVT